MLYAITAVINRQWRGSESFDNGPHAEEWRKVWNTTIQVPTFFLDSNVQGIVSEDHAKRIAERMLRDVNPNAEVSVTAVETVR